MMLGWNRDGVFRFGIVLFLSSTAGKKRVLNVGFEGGVPNRWMYEAGRGVEQNLTQARTYYLLGYTQAPTEVEVCLSESMGTFCLSACFERRSDDRTPWMVFIYFRFVKGQVCFESMLSVHFREKLCIWISPARTHFSEQIFPAGNFCWKNLGFIFNPYMCLHH